MHPGIFNTQADLDFIRTKVNGSDPHAMKAGWPLLKSWYRSGLDYQAKPVAEVLMVRAGIGPAETNFRDDAHAVYAHALQWVVTGNSAHKDKAIEILNAWSAVFVRLTPEDKQNQLEAAWAIPVWVAAAEIIRYYRGGAAGWAPADIARFQKMMGILYGYVPKTFQEKRQNNWGSSAALAALALGVFAEDEALFKVGVDYFNYLLPYQVEKSGLLMETCRDCNHAEYNIIGMLQAAEIAFNQGLDLYDIKLDGQTTPRLLMGMEFHAHALLGTPLDVGQSCGPTDCSRSDKGAGGWEMGFNHFKLRKGLPIPATEKFVLTQNRPAGVSEFHFAGWSTLTHAELGRPEQLGNLAVTGGRIPFPGSHLLIHTGGLMDPAIRRRDFGGAGIVKADGRVLGFLDSEAGARLAPGAYLRDR